MTVVILQDTQTGSTARIDPQRGFNCYDFTAVVDGRQVRVIDADPNFEQGAGSPSGDGIPILFPYPNRIREGRYVWDDREYAVPPSRVRHDPDGNAIHGFCLDRAWRVEESSDTSVVGLFQLSADAPDRLECWPGDFVLRVRYTVRGASLLMEVDVANPGPNPLPWGFGTHPYFRLPLSGDSHPKRCLIEVPAGEAWELERCLPTGGRAAVEPGKDLREGAYFDVLQLDDVLTGLTAREDTIECRIVDEQAGLEVVQRCPADFREMVVYTPSGRDAVCIEPYTCLTDAIRLQQRGVDAGLRVLAPGENFQTWIEIGAGMVMA